MFTVGKDPKFVGRRTPKTIPASAVTKDETSPEPEHDEPEVISEEDEFEEVTENPKNWGKPYPHPATYKDGKKKKSQQPVDYGLKAPDFVIRMMKEGGQKIMEEYVNLSLQTASRQPCHQFYRYRKLNRYDDIECFDYSRVHIKDDKVKFDYIHANWVDGYKQRKAYICTQGPTKETLNHFWRMVFKYKVCVITMVCRLIEGGKREKCALYWPENQGKIIRYGHLYVENKDVQHDFDHKYSITQLEIRTTAKGSKDPKNTETTEGWQIFHIVFWGWPDMGCPKSFDDFHTFVELMRQCQAHNAKLMSGWKGHPLGPPIVVHCSAGVGRTGTLVTYDISERRLIEKGTIDVKETLKTVRSQRNQAIQTKEQYLFLILALVCRAKDKGFLKDLEVTTEMFDRFNNFPDEEDEF